MIELAHVLRTYHVLPEAGGWLDQDATLTDDILTWDGIVGSVEADKDSGSTDPFKDVGARAGDLDMSMLLP